MKKLAMAIGLMSAVLILVAGCKKEAQAPGEEAPAPVSSALKTGITDDSILVGTWGPLTGPAALWGAVPRGTAAYFEMINADRRAAFRLMEALNLILPATTLGDVYSLVLHPASSSHRALSPEERARVGIREGLIRRSVGIEAVSDIIADLEQALAQV